MYKEEEVPGTLPKSPFPSGLAFLLDSRLRRILTDRKKKVLAAGVKSGDMVLELGCGPGFYTEELSRTVGGEGRVYAQDVQAEMVNRLKKKISKQGLNNVVPLLVSSARIPIESGSIDVVFAANVFEEIDKEGLTEATVAEVERLCKEGATVFIEDHKFGGTKPVIEKVVKLLEKTGFRRVIEGESWMSYFVKLQRFQPAKSLNRMI